MLQICLLLKELRPKINGPGSDQKEKEILSRTEQIEHPAGNKKHDPLTGSEFPKYHRKEKISQTGRRHINQKEKRYIIHPAASLFCMDAASAPKPPLSSI